MAKLHPNLRKIYAFHFFNNIAICVVANFLFLDRIFLRMGLNMQQFGTIKGFAYLLPMALNLLLAPFIGKINRDREIVGIGYLIRVFLPLLFLLLPSLINDKTVMVSAVTIILITVHIFPIISNNCIQLLVRANVPKDTLGTHLSWITVVWTLPGFLLAIPLSWLLDRHTGGTDLEFYQTMFVIMFSTGLFEIAASTIIMRLPRQHAEKRPDLHFKDILLPFQNKVFNKILRAIVIFSILNSMISAFINPYLLNVQGFPMLFISIISAVVSLLSILVLPFWGKLADSVGGKNIFTFAVIGLAIGIFALLGKGVIWILVYALFSWEGSRGIFGSGIYSTQQFLVFSQSQEDKRPVFFAASTFVLGLGWFFGSVFGGMLLEWLLNVQKFSSPLPAYRVYFGICGFGSLLLSLFSRRMAADSKKQTTREMGIAMYRTVRTLFGRVR
ncbi:MAG: MFS transporter [Candidatus Brocadiales bacterium]|nr:MFS transporter [Candidatus Brocadiales bacterium]